MTFQFRSKYYSIKIHKVFLLLCIAFFALFLVLSSWQWHRYHFKQTLLNNFDARLKMLPKPFELIRNQAQDDLQFLPVAVDGEYENQLLMFVQNHFHDGKLGFEVLTPIRIADSNKLLLVDRGWVQKPANALLPTVPAVASTQHVTGYIKLLNEYQFILGNNILELDQKPLVMQKIDLQEISQVTKEDFYPFILRLDPENENGFLREWVISSVLPERHLMYAVQWLALAFVVLMGFMYFSVERLTHE